MTRSGNFIQLGHAILEATYGKVPVVAVARLDHLHMHMVSLRLDIATLLIRKPDFSGFTVDDRVGFG